MNLDTIFIRLPSDTIRSIIQKGRPLFPPSSSYSQPAALTYFYPSSLRLCIDQQRMDAEITHLRKTLKDRAHELELRSGGKGEATAAFRNLKGMKSQELYGVVGVGGVSKSVERVVEGGE